MRNEVTRVALKASSRAAVRPRPSPYSAGIDQRYRMQVRQIEEMLGLHPVRKEGVAGQLLGTVGMLLGSACGLITLFYVLSRI